MKLKDSVTKEQLEELGFYKASNINNKFRHDENMVRIRNDNKIVFYNDQYDIWSDAPNILLKMFQLGYIEESEEKQWKQ